MADMRLPAEVWINVFHMALDDPEVLSTSLPKSMAKSSWHKMVYGNWTLRTPQDTFNVIIKRRYALLKAIAATCKGWRQIIAEFMYQCLLFSDLRSVQRLCAVYDKDHNLGKRTTRILLTRYYYAGTRHTMEEMQNAIVSLIRHCPNLQAFVVDSPMSDSFPPIADALCTYPSDSLRTLHIHIPIIHLARLVWLLDALPSLTSVYIEFSGQPEESLNLGAASGLGLTLNVEHLSLRGYSADFVDQAIAWEFPKLHTLAFDFITYRDDFPDIMEFLENVGKQLIELDLNCIPTQDVAAILELCPLLTTFAYNPDWRLPIEPGTRASTLVNAPHENITTIGCHQLLHAFGVGYAATYARYDPLATQYIRCSNDLNFAAMTKANFPKLERIRVLNRSLLRDLETANGPDIVCFERWERWSSRCADEGIRLEDCTGEELGILPCNSDDEEQDEDLDDEEDANEVEAYVQPQQDSISMIRDVLEECRRATQSSSGYGTNGPYTQAY